MSKFIVEGGYKIGGEIAIGGAKNSVLPILAATLLTKEPCVIHNAPRIKDVFATLEILKHVGVRAEFTEKNTITVDSSTLSKYEIPDTLMREMRSSMTILGAMLGRAGEARISLPGGCELGPRPIDLHISSLSKMGAEFSDEHGYITCDCPHPTGADIHLTFPSVGATENIILLAVLSDGITRITNAAREPEIEDLANMLGQMGAKIQGAGSSNVVIEGVRNLHGVTYDVMPDRIITATYMTAVAITGGELLIRNAVPAHVSSVVSALTEGGCDIRVEDGLIEVRRSGPIKPITVRTMPYPGFPTDALAQAMAYSTIAEGNSIFVETIFQNRYRHTDELIRMGARIKIDGRMAVVEGVPRLTAAKLVSTDLRGGAALTIAALAAEGTSEIGSCELIDRGYESIDGDLRSLGARIKRE